ncbi:glycosyltransferase family 2 protein [Fictibacillus sp. KU28468]|uniref:glycosyltransferase family 2 protein n=1 Tax=Fictibacillus sp. KU28468 TaxID=2991053 RepID=UPI00223DF18B|nr:glycosyltransferase family 2 protein [Fictibacillus sp. KU28468]UZJ79609.1 glycosyltransferase [Fictibacillus sp. KU28468]
MNNYKLSVVVLVYNTEEFLRDCLESLVNQTLKGIEIILVNDSSPDNSHLILEEYREKYDNITVIHQENSGGAVAGNNGMKRATGEYVTVMDSDDIVPLDAYEKLYKKAKETESDIVIGKPNILVNGIQKEIIYKRERDVWKSSREMNDLLEFPDIFYDGFYWNKIYKRDFMIDNECFMPPGMLYADRPMVHKAFTKAKKINIITDTVYLWRKREEETDNKSITQMKNDIKNFLDRMSSLHHQLNYFDSLQDEELRTAFLKRNIDRLFFPIKGIAEDEEFREVYLREVKAVLSSIKDVYDNDLGVLRNLYIYMILNDLTEELLFYLSEEPTGPIVEENNHYYWALPFFRDGSERIPDEFYRIKVLLANFVKIRSIQYSDHHLTVSGLRIPNVFDVETATVILRSRTDVTDRIVMPLEENGDGSFSAAGEVDRRNESSIFDIYVEFIDINGTESMFRVSSKMVESTIEDQKANNRIYFTGKGNLSLLISNLRISQVTCDEQRILLDAKGWNTNIGFFMRDRRSKEKIFFQKLDDSQFQLPWKYFLEKHGSYDLYYRLINDNVRISAAQFDRFEPQLIRIDDRYIDLYKTGNNNVSLMSFTMINRITGKLKKLIKMKK